MIDTIQALVGGLEARGTATAVITYASDGTEEWTYRRLGETARRLSAGLSALAVTAGDKVAVIAPNSAALVVLRLALAHAGIVAVPIDDHGTASDFTHALADSAARILFTTPALLATVEASARSRLEHVYLLAGLEADGVPSWTSLLAPEPAEPVEVAPDDITAIIYTSGTTGAAKGVPLSHRNFLVNVRALSGGGFARPGDHVLVPLPLHHSYPYMAGLLVPLACGASVVLPSGATGPEISRALNDGDVTVMLGVPRLYDAMVEAILGRIAGAGAPSRIVFGALLKLCSFTRRRFGTRLGRVLMAPVRRRIAPRLRLLGSGGARLDDRAGWILEGLGFEVLSGYGLVETSSVATYNRRGRGRIGCEGHPVDGTELRITEPDALGIGEILVRGPHVFSGYFNDPAASAEVFTEDGWFRTGDLGRLERDGALVVTGRAKEIIVLADGKNVGPEEVEAALGESPYIAEAGVFEHGGRLAAVVVPDDDALKRAPTVGLGELLRVEVARRCTELAPHKRVTGFRVHRAPLPKTRLGKLRRFELAALYEGSSVDAHRPKAEPGPEDLALLADPLARRVMERLGGRFPDAVIDLDTSPQLDLGVDSLIWLEIAHEVEADVGAAIDDQALTGAVTVRDLLGAVITARDNPAITDGPARREVAWRRQRASHVAGALIWRLNRTMMRLFLRVTCEGPLPPDGPAVLFAVNHASDIDPFVFAAALPLDIARRTWWSAEVTRVFSTPVRRWLARRAQIFPINDRYPADSLARAQSVLDGGDHVVWFPESWRSPDGRLQPFLRGVGVIVEASRPRICPVYIDGTFAVLPRHRRVPRPRRVRLIFGPTVDAARHRRRHPRPCRRARTGRG